MSIATVVSIAVHILILILFIRAHRTPQEIKQSEAAIRFVELIRSNPREFVEAPGPAVLSAPITAPFSDTASALPNRFLSIRPNEKLPLDPIGKTSPRTDEKTVEMTTASCLKSWNLQSSWHSSAWKARNACEYIPPRSPEQSGLVSPGVRS